MEKESYDVVWKQCRHSINQYKKFKTIEVPMSIINGLGFYDDLNGKIAISGWIRPSAVWINVHLSIDSDGVETKYINGVLVK